MSKGQGESREVELKAGKAKLNGTLSVPTDTTAVVVFAHGSGSSRFSPRNRFVADALNSAGFATLLFDLLTPEEEAIDAVTGHLRFDVEFLAQRLLAATAWLVQEEQTRLFRIGYFGASTGAAAALIAAAELPRSVQAVVSRGGRPDLAHEALSRVEAPTLLIVGANDTPVIELNRLAYNQLQSPKRLDLVAGATHLFEEPGALETVSTLAQRWFTEYLLWPQHKRRTTAS